jgi:hypothetical protein
MYRASRSTFEAVFCLRQIFRVFLRVVRPPSVFLYFNPIAFLFSGFAAAQRFALARLHGRQMFRPLP